MAADLSACWRQLVVTDILCKLIAFMVLTPLLGLAFRVMLASSGDAFLADQDILLFLLGPFGAACAVLAGGIWLAVVALEQAALLAILSAERAGLKTGVVQALHVAGRHALPVLEVTVRLVAFTLLAAVPFLAGIGTIYVLMLGDYDINFYLQEKPPEFLAAVAIATLLVLALVGVLLRLFSGWFLALPVVLFEQVPPRDAPRASRA
ncbi:MAG: hypothetical protein AAGG46_09895, partial [Planctomycetota bacterium]